MRIRPAPAGAARGCRRSPRWPGRATAAAPPAAAPATPPGARCGAPLPRWSRSGCGRRPSPIIPLRHCPLVSPRPSMTSALTHFDSRGQAQMVDVAAKGETHRVARAGGSIRMAPATRARIVQGGAAKGDVIGVARIAAIQAAKRTAELVPLCHPLPLTRVSVDFRSDEGASAVHCEVQAETVGRTGVEMEALCAVQVALLTIYDMCKAVDRPSAAIPHPGADR